MLTDDSSAGVLYVELGWSVEPNWNLLQLTHRVRDALPTTDEDSGSSRIDTEKPLSTALQHSVCMT